MRVETGAMTADNFHGSLGLLLIFCVHEMVCNTGRQWEKMKKELQDRSQSVLPGAITCLFRDESLIVVGVEEED